MIAWRKEPESILVEMANETNPNSKTGRPGVHRLVRFLDGPNGIVDYIIDQTSEHSRFDLEGRVGDEGSVRGLELLPETGT